MVNSECDLWHGTIHNQFEQGLLDAMQQKVFAALCIAQLEGALIGNEQVIIDKARYEFNAKFNQALDDWITKAKNN